MSVRQLIFAAACMCLVGGAATAQTLTVTYPSASGATPPLSELPNGPKPNGNTEHAHRPVPSHAGTGGGQDTAVQTFAGPLLSAAGGVTFDGPGANGFAPSDSNIAVGPNHIFAVVNSVYQIFTKTGASLLGPKSLSSLWTGVGGGCATANAGDVVVQYDKIADRWILTELSSLSSPYGECIAVSTTSDPTGTYNAYYYTFGTTLPDYPKFGVWPTTTNSAYLATFNQFANGATFTGVALCAYDRAALLSGAASPAQICFTINDDSYLPSDVDGSTPPADGTPGYFLTYETLSSLRAYELAPNFASPGSSILTQVSPDLPVTAFSELCGGGTCVAQSGTNNQLDSLGDRPMYRLAYRNFGDHQALVFNNSVSTGVRWYELRAATGAGAAYSVYQQGTYAPDSTTRWMGSAAMDQAGDLAIGYSASSSSIHPAVRYSGRGPGDALGSLESELSIIEGAGSQTSGLHRWGDYSSLRIDPSDDCTFWYINEYLQSSGAFNWSTRVGSFKFSSCGGQVAAPTFNPPAGSYGSGQSVMINSATAGAFIRYTTDGSTPSSTVGTVYLGAVAVSSSLTLKAIAYKTGMVDSLVTSASYVITGGGSNTAAFVKTDTATQGTWKGAYGADGYNVIDDTVSYPAYVTVTPASQLNTIWTTSTSDVRALQKALSLTDRLAATWYTFSSFTIDLNFNDAAQHQVAVYNLDWDFNGRTQTVSILDGTTNAVLDSQSVSSFQNGKYLVWKLTGHVIIRVTNTGPANAVISGLFFDPAGASSTVAAPTFNPPAGSYGSGQSVMINSATAGAFIRYTTDGSTPSSTVGTVYLGAVAVSSSLTLKAIAYKTGMVDSSSYIGQLCHNRRREQHSGIRKDGTQLRKVPGRGHTVTDITRSTTGIVPGIRDGDTRQSVEHDMDHLNQRRASIAEGSVSPTGWRGRPGTPLAVSRST